MRRVKQNVRSHYKRINGKRRKVRSYRRTVSRAPKKAIKRVEMKEKPLVKIETEGPMGGRVPLKIGFRNVLDDPFITPQTATTDLIEAALKEGTYPEKLTIDWIADLKRGGLEFSSTGPWVELPRRSELPEEKELVYTPTPEEVRESLEKTNSGMTLQQKYDMIDAAGRAGFEEQAISNLSLKQLREIEKLAKQAQVPEIRKRMKELGLKWNNNKSYNYNMNVYQNALADYTIEQQKLSKLRRELRDKVRLASVQLKRFNDGVWDEKNFGKFNPGRLLLPLMKIRERLKPAFFKSNETPFPFDTEIGDELPKVRVGKLNEETLNKMINAYGKTFYKQFKNSPEPNLQNVYRIFSEREREEQRALQSTKSAKQRAIDREARKGRFTVTDEETQLVKLLNKQESEGSINTKALKKAISAGLDKIRDLERVRTNFDRAKKGKKPTKVTPAIIKDGDRQVARIAQRIYQLQKVVGPSAQESIGPLIENLDKTKQRKIGVGSPKGRGTTDTKKKKTKTKKKKKSRKTPGQKQLEEKFKGAVFSQKVNQERRKEFVQPSSLAPGAKKKKKAKKKANKRSKR